MRNALLRCLGGLVTATALTSITGSARAADHPIGGDALNLRVLRSQPAATFRAGADPAIDPALAPDPRRYGAVLEIAGAGIGFGSSGAITLDPQLWRGLGQPPGSAGYEYVDSDAASGVKTVVFRAGRTGGTIAVNAGGNNWRFALDQAQEAVSVRLTIGSEVYCALFDDDHMTVNRPGQVSGKNAPPPADCAPPACPNGVVEPGEECDDGNRTYGDCCNACRIEANGSICSDTQCSGPGTCLDGICRRAGLACDDLTLLRRVSKVPVEASFRNQIVRSLVARVKAAGQDPVARARNFLDRFRDMYALTNPFADLHVRRVRRQGDVERVLFYQRYQGLDVYSAELLVSMRDGHVFSAVGGLLPSGRVDIEPRLSADDAEGIARGEAPGPNVQLSGPPTLVVYDRGLLADVPSDPRLAWRVAMRGSPVARVFVDAQTGAVLAALPSALEGVDFEILDAEEEANFSSDSCFDLSADPTIADEDDFDSDYLGDPDATGSAAAYPAIYDWFLNTFGLHSYDDDDAEVEIFIHANAATAWSSDCDLMQVQTGWVDFESIAHEFTHGAVSYGSDLPYECKSGALNESYADIMAVLADRGVNGAANWSVGENLTGGQGPIRDIRTPSNFCNPDHRTLPTQNSSCSAIAYVQCPSPPMLANDWGGVHTNSGIPNRTAYLMAAGGSQQGVTVTGMGRGKTQTAKFEALRNMPSASGFQEARAFEIGEVQNWASTGLNGYTQSDVCTVRNAWAAVGIGPSDLDCNALSDADLDGDMVLDINDNCNGVPNPGQEDMDHDGVGDACDYDKNGDGIPDDDTDGDGFPSASDTCPGAYNPLQGPCNDLDDDGVLNANDNCFLEPNPSQTDSNNDGQGDACDPDTLDGGDGVPNNDDNCPAVYNPNQADSDNDGYGDACDKCPNDADGNIAFTAYGSDFGFGGGMPYQPDSDGDGVPDNCDHLIFFKKDVPISYLDLAVGSRGPMEIDRSAVTGSHLRTQIDVCGGDCVEVTDPRYGVQLVLAGLDPRIRVWISDNRGRSVRQAKVRGRQRVLRFQPQGGRKYYLNFYFRPEFDQSTATFHLRMGRWRPRIPRPIPRPAQG